MITLISVIIIIFSSTSIGIYFADKEKGRYSEIVSINDGFSILKSEIDFSELALPFAMDKINEKIDKKVGTFFKNVSKILKENKVENISEAFIEKLDTDFEYLNENDKRTLIEFSKSLGSVDKKGQVELFYMLEKKLNKIIEDAEKIKNKNIKMYRVLGFSIGAIISILLL